MYHVEEHGLPPDTWWVKRMEEESSLALTSLSTGCCSQWKISCDGCPPLMEHGERRTACMVGGACGQPYDWREPHRLLTLQIGATANEQVVFPTYEVLDGECDHLISALKCGTNLLGVVVNGPTESSKNRLVEASESFIAVSSVIAVQGSAQSSSATLEQGNLRTCLCG